MKHFITILFLFNLLPIFGQNTIQNCVPNSEWWKDYKRYIPDESTPIKTIRLNFIFPQRSDGSGNFEKDDPEMEKIFEDVMTLINKNYANLKNPEDKICYTGTDFVPDSKIRFELVNKIYIKDEYAWDLGNGQSCPNENNWYLNDLDARIRSIPNYKNAINIYFPVDKKIYEEVVLNKNPDFNSFKTQPPCSQLPSNRDIERSSKLCMGDIYSKFYWMKNVVVNDRTANPELHAWEPTIRHWVYSGLAHTLIHELGHSIGLSHSNEFHGRNECYTSIMNQRYGAPHNYLQPTELGKIHRDLSLTNIRSFLTNKPYSGNAMVIKESTMLDVDMTLYQDIYLSSGTELTVTCVLRMPEQGSVILAKGAKLIVDGGTIRANDDNWKGLIFKQKCMKKKKGQVEIINQGQILNSQLPDFLKR